MLTPTQALAGPSDPDFCETPTVIGGFPYTDARDTSSATVDFSDPNLPCGAGGMQSHSVWYTFTAPFFGSVVIDTNGSNFDTVLAVLTGDCGSLSVVPSGCNDDFIGLQSQVTVNVVQGATYMIEVTSFSTNAGGDLVLNAAFTPTCGGGVAGPDSICDDGDVCNGAETCDETLGCLAGTPLVCDDNNVCNGAETCDSIAGCQSGTPLICDDSDVCTDDSCDAITGCEFVEDLSNDGVCIARCPLIADPLCDESLQAKFDSNEGKSGNEKLKIEVKKFPFTTTAGDFGDPVFADSSFGVCIYWDDDTLLWEFLVDQAGEDCDGKPCWKAKGDKGFDYKDKLAEEGGITRLTFQGGNAGSGKASLQAKNKESKGQFNLVTGFTYALSGTVANTVQFRSSDGFCVGATMNQVKKDDPGSRYQIEKK